MTDDGDHDPHPEHRDCPFAQFFENMTRKESSELSERLALHGAAALRHHGPSSGRYGWTAEDLAQEALMLAFSGSRRYPGPPVTIVTPESSHIETTLVGSMKELSPAARKLITNAANTC